MKGLERKLEQYSSLTVEQESKTMRRTEINLNSMSKDGHLIYLKYLVKDLGQALQDMAGTEPRYDYINTLIQHAIQAEQDLTTMIDSKRLTEEA